MDTDAVLVIGATGQQGGAVARALLARGVRVHAFVRDPAGAPALALQDAGAVLVPGDLDDRQSLESALAGVRRVFMALTMMTGPVITAEGIALEERRGKAVADLAARAGIDHLVYSSLSGAGQGTGIPYIEGKERIERHLHARNLPATVLRPVSFMENFLSYNRPALIDGELTVSLAIGPTTPLALIAVADIGQAAALAFAHPGDLVGRHLHISGDLRTGPQIAEVFGRAAGRPARFSTLPLERLRAFDPQVAAMFAWFEQRPAPEPDPALKAHRFEPMTLERWVRSIDWRPPTSP
ncbi:NmrA/HSCARG family protein [Actinomadura gamaensis]|uniref:NmrA/HSCARG family protein n=1 Tax=Actinomadura gamaensis TaxID=1763541 RepID=A0ABV9TUE5_9ACTN